MTVAQLADKVGLSQPQLTRIEGSKRGLSVAVAERLAKALSVDTVEVLGIAGELAAGQPLGFAEDLVPYVQAAGDLPVPRTRPNVDPWLVKSNCLDRLNIFAGDIVFVDVSAEAVESIAPLKAVVIQIYDSDPEVLRAVTVMRQFVPPSLLITNSSEANLLPLDIERDPVAIKGVIIGSQRSFRS